MASYKIGVRGWVVVDEDEELVTCAEDVEHYFEGTMSNHFRLWDLEYSEAEETDE